MEIKQIDDKEFLSILKDNKINIPIWSDSESLECYDKKELIKVCEKDKILAVFLIPINNNGMRREYRYFPYCMPILLSNFNNLKQKNIYKFIFNYIFNKYEYTFIPLHPNFKIISSIASQKGFIEMRHTHVLYKKIELDKINSKLRNHINNAKKNVHITIDTDYSNFDFSLAIKGNIEEQTKRSCLAKKLIDHKKGFVVKAIQNDNIIAGLIIVYDKEWAYLLHSYQKCKIRGTVPFMIYEGTKIIFDKLNLKVFDFEGSVIDEIDDFFSNFDANIITYPYLIHTSDKNLFYKLLERSINIDGRVKKLNEENSNFN